MCFFTYATSAPICAAFHVTPTGGIAPGRVVSTPLWRIPTSDDCDVSSGLLLMSGP
jgi:hypothetical protein